LICWHGTGAVKKVSVPLYVTVNLALWIFAPRWGQNFLWLTGSLNYLWSLTLALLFLVPYRRTFEDPSYRMPLAVSVLFFIPGLINGWNMQNLSAGIIIALCCYFVLKLIKKERCRLFEITGAAGLLTGFLFLAGSSQLSFPGPGTLLFRLAGITVNFVIFCGFLAALFALLVIESVFSRKVKPDLLSLGYALIALASFYAMVLGFSSRAVVCPVVFFLIGIISVGRTYESVFSRYRRRLFLLAALFSVPSLLSGGREILKGYLLSRGRERHIALQREAGVLDAVVKTSIPVGDTHSALYDGGDVWVYTREIPYNLEEYHVHNGAMALFYRVRSINGLGTQPRTNVNAAIKEFLKKRKGEDLGIEDLFTFVYEQWGK
jgi:hypothetical protein